MLAGCYSGAAGVIVLLIAKIYKNVYSQPPFSEHRACLLLNAFKRRFSGLFDNKKNRAVLEEIATFQAYSIAPYAKKFYRLLT